MCRCRLVAGISAALAGRVCIAIWILRPSPPNRSVAIKGGFSFSSGFASTDQNVVTDALVVVFYL